MGLGYAIFPLLRDMLISIDLNTNKKRITKKLVILLNAGPTGLEPATSGLTGQCANQLHYDPVELC